MKKSLLLLSIAVIAAHSSSSTEGYFKLPHNSYSGSIWSYNLESTFPSITESENYAYGFDGLTKECYNTDKTKDDSELIHCFNHPEKDKARLPITYISVEKGKAASFTPNNFTCENCLYSNSKVALIQTKKYIEKNKELILEDIPNLSYDDLDDSKNHLTDGKAHSIQIAQNNIQKAGIYQIILSTPNSNENSSTEPSKGIKSKKKKQKHYTWLQDKPFAEIHILPYESLPKKMIFVPFNGTGENRWDVVKEKNGFNKDSVIYYFNKIYKQAVLKPEVDELKADDFGLSEDIEINMTHPDNNTFDEMYKKGVITALTNNIEFNTQSPYWHIIYAINKVRKKWILDKCYSNFDSDESIEINDDRKYDLKACRSDWENENENTHYTLISYANCSEKDRGEPTKTNVIIKAKQNSLSSGNYKMSYYIFDENDPNKKLGFKSCDYLYTDNGYPIIPNITAVTAGVHATSVQLGPIESRHDGYLPYGSIIFVPRGIGESAHYVLMHELGHSYGLTDVAKSATIYRVIDQDKNKDADNAYYNDDLTATGKDLIPRKNGELPFKTGVKDYRKYLNYYASKETNLMTWEMPTGPKIRYRKTPIACTSGTIYYKESRLAYDENGKPITGIDEDGKPTTEQGKKQLKEFARDKGSFGAIERVIKDGFENQWECIRGKCYDKKYSTDYSTIQRKSFWLYTKEKKINNEINFCYDNQFEEGENARNILGYLSKYSNEKRAEYKKYIIETHVQIVDNDNENNSRRYELFYREPVDNDNEK